jgi:hypothetical protein
VAVDIEVWGRRGKLASIRVIESLQAGGEKGWSGIEIRIGGQ